MSGLAGVATALAVAIVLTVYFRSRYRSARDIAQAWPCRRRVVLGLLAFVAYDMRHAALAYLGINPAKPAVEFEIRLPMKAVSAVADTQIELHTDRNQTLAQLQNLLALDSEGRSVLRGSVPLEYRTTDRVVVVNLPGQAQLRVQAAAGGKPKPLRPVRALASGRSRRLARTRAKKRATSSMTPSRSAIACARALIEGEDDLERSHPGLGLPRKCGLERGAPVSSPEGIDPRSQRPLAELKYGTAWRSPRISPPSVVCVHFKRRRGVSTPGRGLASPEQKHALVLISGRISVDHVNAGMLVNVDTFLQIFLEPVGN